MTLRFRRLLLSWAVAVLASGLGSTALAKGDDLPLNARIVGATSTRTIDFATAVDPAGATIFSDEVADIEPMATTLAFGPGPARPRRPGVTRFFLLELIPP